MRNLGPCLATLVVMLLLTVLNSSAAYSHRTSPHTSRHWHLFGDLSPSGQLAPVPDMDFVTENGTQWAVKVSATDQSEQFLKLKQIAEEHGVGPQPLNIIICYFTTFFSFFLTLYSAASLGRSATFATTSFLNTTPTTAPGGALQRCAPRAVAALPQPNFSRAQLSVRRWTPHWRAIRT